MENKRLVCTSRGGLVANVQLNGVLPSEKLTPKLARRALRVAFGNDNGGRVVDAEYGHGYAVYPNTARKLAREEPEMMDGWRLTTEDRVEQVNYLTELADNLAQMGTAYDANQTADQIIAFARSEEGAASWAMTWPEWMDDHDWRLLAEYVSANLWAN